MRYRRNSDVQLRDLARLATHDDSASILRYVAALHRLEQHPYWFSVRELMPSKDTVYWDQSHPDEPRWEDRPLSKDRRLIFRIHIPLSEKVEWLQKMRQLLEKKYVAYTDKNEFTAWLGEITCTEVADSTGNSFLQGCVKSFRDLHRWDQWERDASNSGLVAGRLGISEIERANQALICALQGSAVAFMFRAIININLPLDWHPSQPIDPGSVTPLNGQERPYDQGMQDFRPEDPQIPIPEQPFLLENFLGSHFINWLGDTTSTFGQQLHQELWPLGPQLPTNYLGKHINLHYWIEWDGVREIAKDYYPARKAYDVAYKVNWWGDSSIRFWRWGSDPGWAEGTHENGLSACEVVHNTESEQEHQQAYALAHHKAWTSLQKRLRGLIAVAEKYGYQVTVVKGNP